MAQGTPASLRDLESLHCPSLPGGQAGQELQLCLGILEDPVGLGSLAGLEIPDHPSLQSSPGGLALLGDPLDLGDLEDLQNLVGPTPPSLPRGQCILVLP